MPNHSRHLRSRHFCQLELRGVVLQLVPLDFNLLSFIHAGSLTRGLLASSRVLHVLLRCFLGIRGGSALLCWMLINGHAGRLSPGRVDYIAARAFGLWNTAEDCHVSDTPLQYLATTRNSVVSIVSLQVYTVLHFVIITVFLLLGVVILVIFLDLLLVELLPCEGRSHL